MELEIRLYATLRDKVGQSRIQLELEESVTVTELIEKVRAKYPVMTEALDTAVVSVNRPFAGQR